jgi:glycolate oxidase iron-sulfur subunit
MSAARPPAADPLVALADRCVQCGLCLPACPTYRRDGLEPESPRGRIALIRAWTLDTVGPTGAGDAHLDHCLACRSCEAVCPAGVEFGALLVQARTRQRARRRATWRQRFVEALVARPRLLTALLETYRRTWPMLPARLRPLPRPPARTGRHSGHRGRETVALFIGCVARAYEPRVRAALVRLCDAAGVAVVEPAGQACCGALHAHAGNRNAAETLAATNRAAFAQSPMVLTLASGCHAAVQAAIGDGRATVDAFDFLVARLDHLRFRGRRERVALHLPCTQRNAARAVPAMRRLLARVPGLDVVVLDAGLGCCGAAGSQMLLDRERAAGYRQPLVEQAVASGATRVLSANLGCRLHLAAALPMPVQHPLELLADALDA